MDKGVCRALAVKSGGLGSGLVGCVDPRAGIESPYDIYERSKLVLT